MSVSYLCRKSIVELRCKIPNLFMLLMCFRLSVWANHGDEISIQYSGTPALKGDFVRYFCHMFNLGSE